MIEIRNVPVELLNTSKYYTTSKSIVGKYSNYNTMIAKGSLFYTDLVVEEKDLPDSAFSGVPKDIQ